jgi:hypothetical protein
VTTHLPTSLSISTTKWGKGKGEARIRHLQHKLPYKKDKTLQAATTEYILLCGETECTPSIKKRAIIGTKASEPIVPETAGRFESKLHGENN